MSCRSWCERKVTVWNTFVVVVGGGGDGGFVVVVVVVAVAAAVVDTGVGGAEKLTTRGRRYRAGADVCTNRGLDLHKCG